MNDPIDDPIDDLVAMRLAGAGPVLEPLDPSDEYAYPPRTSHPHAARPGAMPSVADVVAELQTARGLLKALAARPNIGYAIGNPQCWCRDCDADIPDDAGKQEIGVHDPDCPWRQAAEYLAGLEGHQ